MSPKGLGDMAWKGEDPLETYFDLVRQGVQLPRQKWIVQPEWNPLQECQIPGMEAIQKLIECHGLPRLWQLLTDLWTKFQCGTYFVKRPNWLEPPITARVLDLRTENCVTVVPGYGSDMETIVQTLAFPDRYVGTILGFGHAVNDPVAWGTLKWSLKINDAPLPCYQDFVQQIGELHAPTMFPSPSKIKHGDVFTVTVKNPGNVAYCVFSRVYAFMFPSKMLSQDGSFVDYHTL